MKNQDILVMLDERITEIARAIVQEAIANSIAPVQLSDNRSVKLREQLSFIKAKEHVTVKEAALLLSCSESHIRKLVMLARKGKTRRPVPFVDMEGVTIFPREILLGWARPTQHLQVVKKMKQRKSSVDHKNVLSFLDFSSRFLPGKGEAT